MTSLGIGGFETLVILLAILMMLAGTTFAGHDWASGSVSNQLLFEPRRPRVWAAKAARLYATASTIVSWSNARIRASINSGPACSYNPTRWPTKNPTRDSRSAPGAGRAATKCE